MLSFLFTCTSCVLFPYVEHDFSWVKMLLKNYFSTTGVTLDGSRRFGSAGNTHQNHSAQIFLQAKYEKH